jgi:hypothetical protein
VQLNKNYGKKTERQLLQVIGNIILLIIYTGQLMFINIKFRRDIFPLLNVSIQARSLA